MSALDRQVSGTHYKFFPVQPVEFIMANQMGFAEGNVIKYVLREKDGLADLQKARHYIDFILEASAYQRALYRIRAACRFSAWWHDSLNADFFIKANGIKGARAGVVRHVSWWNNGGRTADLQGAAKWLDELIAETKAAALKPAHHPV